MKVQLEEVKILMLPHPLTNFEIHIIKYSYLRKFLTVTFPCFHAKSL